MNYFEELLSSYNKLKKRKFKLDIITEQGTPMPNAGAYEGKVQGAIAAAQGKPANAPYVPLPTTYPSYKMFQSEKGNIILTVGYIQYKLAVNGQPIKGKGWDMLLKAFMEEETGQSGDVDPTEQELADQQELLYHQV